MQQFDNVPNYLDYYNEFDHWLDPVLDRKERKTDPKYEYTIPNLSGKYSKKHIEENPRKFRDYKKKLKWGTIYDYVSTNPLDDDDISKKSNEYLDKRDDIKCSLHKNIQRKEHFGGSEHNNVWLIIIIIVIAYFIFLQSRRS